MGEQQIIAETTLFPAAEVADKATMNDLILRTHHLLPLTTICINTIGGEDFYAAFGSLSVDSKGSVIIEEIEACLATLESLWNSIKIILKRRQQHESKKTLDCFERSY